MSLGLVTMSTSSCSDNSPAPFSIDSSDYDPHTLPPFLSLLELQNLCECADNVTKLEVLATPHSQLYWQITHFQALDCTIWCLERLVQKKNRNNYTSRRNHQGISSSHHPKESWAIQALPSLLTLTMLSCFNPSPQFSPNFFSNSLLTTNPISTISDSLAKVTFLLPYGPLPPTWCCSVWRLQQGRTYLGEVYTWL